MQNEKDNIDILIKSLLENAEEEVPAGVWEKVSSRLDKQAVKPVFLWWRRTAVAIAVAASVAAGIFLNYKPDRSQGGTGTDSFAESNKETPFEVIEKQELPYATKELLADGGNIMSRYTAAKQIEVKGTAPLSLPVPNRPFRLPQTIENEGNIALSANPEHIAEYDESSAAEAFARMAWEDERSEKSSGVSLFLGGDVQSNGNPRAATGMSMKRKPGSIAPVFTTVEQVSKESSYSVPVSLGLGVRIPFAKRWSIGTGISYSILERTFTGLYNEFDGEVKTRTINSDIKHSLQYIGMPLNVYFDILGNKNIDFYTFAGGSVEKAVVNRYRISQTPEDINYSTSVKGVQWSAAMGFGVEFRPAKYIGIYIDPSLRYYFDCNQPISIRTQQPLMMSFEIGLRVNL